MPVNIGSGYSIVIRKQAIARANISADALIGEVGDLVSQDEGLLVLGPLYEPSAASKKLDELGLEYFEDYFDIPSIGGPVAEWCEVQLRLRES